MLSAIMLPSFAIGRMWTAKGMFFRLRGPHDGKSLVLVRLELLGKRKSSFPCQRMWRSRQKLFVRLLLIPIQQEELYLALIAAVAYPYEPRPKALLGRLRQWTVSHGFASDAF